MAHHNHHLIFVLSSLVVIALVALQGTHAVQYDVTNEAVGTPGGTIFDNQIGIEYSRQTLESGSAFIWQIFGQSNEADRKNVQRISMFVRPVDGVASTSGDQIQVSANYIARFSGDVKREITGVLYHELTHVWQWDGTPGPRTPGSLIEGIADYVRLKANYPAPGWVQAGAGNSWDERSDVTAHFLDYCNSLRAGFVAELNSKMRTGYNANYFVELLGKTAEQLFSDYKAMYAS
ncbi:Uncharacterized protein family [Macleaya cordata]|uniref:Uncharacterized protein family n=1 Tax=Macleaya cordata TaxID=56857 RepID=A0A200PV24_MACCD|nr:Uncharacterized protein family [Macleaya cordata]